MLSSLPKVTQLGVEALGFSWVCQTPEPELLSSVLPRITIIMQKGY